MLMPIRYPSVFSLSVSHCVLITPESRSACSLKTNSHTFYTTYVHYLNTLCFKIKNTMASFNFASESPFGKGTRNVLRPDQTPGDDPTRRSGNSSNSFSIHFCNIRGLRPNFHSVEHHLLSSKPHLLFLTETQVSRATDMNLYSIPS